MGNTNGPNKKNYPEIKKPNKESRKAKSTLRNPERNQCLTKLFQKLKKISTKDWFGITKILRLVSLKTFWVCIS